MQSQTQHSPQAQQKPRANGWALLPILVFLILYLGVGILFEYVLKESMGFYIMSVVVAFMVALVVAFCQNRGTSFDEKIRLCAEGAGDSNIITMIFIFLLAGAFGGLASAAGCADSTAQLLLSVIPSRFAVLGIFVIACLISMAMGTSCGTITVMSALTLSVANTTGISVALCFGALVGGSMFGDNLSFISDTTIAATKTQGCEMKDKFRENFKIALPAALATIVLLLIFALVGESAEMAQFTITWRTVVQALPYFSILIAAMLGVQVFLVLLGGIVLTALVGFATSTLAPVAMLSSMGSGVSGMYETVLVALLVACLGSLVKANGGFEAILAFVRKHFRGEKGGQLGIALLSSAMDVATANNTVAIVMAAPIATEVREEYDISPRKTASLLDIFTCIFQGIIPYGAQMLYASAAAGIAAVKIIPYMFYPYFLAVSAVLFILLGKKKTA
ncbi:MAG: Na+/H+ antiporter NhaC family protein [Ruminococcaceae bacterium]|nr:Na+/H+ antiporter NhaC family protein [Oscillospiraceae bacterium]